MGISQGIKLTETPMEKPNFLDEMIHLSEVLATNIIHVRVDWYFVNGQLYFGEMTFMTVQGLYLS